MLPGWKLAPGRDSVVGSAGGELWRGAGGARRTGVGALEWPSGCSGTRASLVQATVKTAMRKPQGVSETGQAQTLPGVVGK